MKFVDPTEISEASTRAAAIFFYDSLLDFLPETQADLGVELAMAVIPPTKFLKVFKIGHKAIKAGERQGTKEPIKMARKAGIEVVSGAEHLQDIDPKTGELITTIPHSANSTYTKQGIVDAILDFAKGG